MDTRSLIRNPRFVRWALQLDRLPPGGWLALQALTLLPAWWWMARRLADGSDDPLGLLALATLGLVAWQHRHALRPTPAAGWLAAAVAATLLTTVLRIGVPGLVAPWPPLATSLLAVLAMASTLRAFLPPAARTTGVGSLSLLGLAVLALPLLSSLQFYAGYPLRIATAEATRWLLAPAFWIWREGSTLVVDGRQIIVDAPCSGVQMVWLGYFTAYVTALWARLPDRSLLTRLPAVGLLVLAGNIVRNTVLVAAEGSGAAWPAWSHDAVGLVVLAGVCLAVAGVMLQPPRPAAHRPSHPSRRTGGLHAWG